MATSFEKNWDLLAAQKAPIGIVGLGYVGLPLAVALAKHFKVVGFDIAQARVAELKTGKDHSGEVANPEDLKRSNLSYHTTPDCLKDCPVVIVTVPTPIDGFKKPDLHPLVSASRDIGANLYPGAVVCYESTVYPGLTEGPCRETIEAAGKVYGKDFFLGYSPERINPGDRVHTVETVKKIVAGDRLEVTKLLAQVYGKVVQAGLHLAPSIMVAEAAKILENTQRDVNIALINECALVFEKLGIDTEDVLAAARTKWNFLDFHPGLVGGHCIGVDPYYLIHLAAGLDIHPNVMNAGRRINDDMGRFVGATTLKHLLQGGATTRPLRVAVLGVTFKENVPDFRNSRVIDVIRYLRSHGVETVVIDPMVDSKSFAAEYEVDVIPEWKAGEQFHAAVVAVPHAAFKKSYDVQWLAEHLQGPRLVMDVKGVYDRERAKAKGLFVWRL